MILVVGAGPCGLFVASRLHQLGHNVVVLCSNQKTISFKSHKLKKWIQSPGVGGRANLWGGWLDIPSQKCFEEENWPISYRSIKAQEKKVRAWLESSKQFTSRKLKKLDYKNKIQSNKNWNHWPFKIIKNIKVMKLIEKDQEIIGVQCIDEKKRKSLKIFADEVILCGSPFSTLSLIGKLNEPPKSLATKMTNHIVAGLITIYPKESNKKNQKISTCFKITRKGVIELQGPLPGKNLDPRWGEYEYYKLHYIAEIKHKKFQIKDFEVRGNITFSKKEIKMAKMMERKLHQECNSLSLKNETRYKIQKTLDITNIAHESGGAPLGEVVDDHGQLKNYGNLTILDASIMPSGLKTYPTLTLLCLISRLLEKFKKSNT
jgi:hypothetical protein